MNFEAIRSNTKMKADTKMPKIIFCFASGSTLRPKMTTKYVKNSNEIKNRRQQATNKRRKTCKDKREYALRHKCTRNTCWGFGTCKFPHNSIQGSRGRRKRSFVATIFVGTGTDSIPWAGISPDDGGVGNNSNLWGFCCSTAASVARFASAFCESSAVMSSCSSWARFKYHWSKAASHEDTKIRNFNQIRATEWNVARGCATGADSDSMSRRHLRINGIWSVSAISLKENEETDNPSRRIDLLVISCSLSGDECSFVSRSCPAKAVPEFTWGWLFIFWELRIMNSIAFDAHAEIIEYMICSENAIIRIPKITQPNEKMPKIYRNRFILLNRKKTSSCEMRIRCSGSKWSFRHVWDDAGESYKINTRVTGPLMNLRNIQGWTHERRLFSWNCNRTNFLGQYHTLKRSPHA